jgi:branched-chain amino acid transport system substrate-binding protein
MKELPTDDKLFGKGTVRADGRKIHPMYLVGWRSRRNPRDYFKVRRGVPPAVGRRLPLVNR